MHANNGADEEKFLYVGWWPLKEKRQAKEDMDGSHKDRLKDVKHIKNLTRDILEWRKKKSCSYPNIIGTMLSW